MYNDNQKCKGKYCELILCVIWFDFVSLTYALIFCLVRHTSFEISGSEGCKHTSNLLAVALTRGNMRALNGGPIRQDLRVLNRMQRE